MSEKVRQPLYILITKSYISGVPMKYIVDGKSDEYIALRRSIKRLESDLAEAKALGNVRRVNELNDEIEDLNRRAGKFESSKYGRGSTIVLNRALGKRVPSLNIPDAILKRRVPHGSHKKGAR